MDESSKPEEELDKPLTAEQRRENLRALLGEDEADKYFDVLPLAERESLTNSTSSTAVPGLVNWNFVGIVLIAFVLIMGIVYAVTTGSAINEETIAPTNPAITPIPLETPPTR